MLQALLLEEFEGVVLQVHGDDGAAIGLFGIRDGVFAETVRAPEMRLLLAGAPGQDLDLVRDHEGRVEADAELADQLAALS